VARPPMMRVGPGENLLDGQGREQHPFLRHSSVLDQYLVQGHPAGKTTANSPSVREGSR
jgi:hypothetical protein